MASIDPFIHRKTVVLHQDSTIAQAKRAMCEHKIGSVMVADHDGHMVGIATDRDLVCHSSEHAPIQDQLLSAVMTKSLVTVDEYAAVQDVVNLMEEYGIRRIPVIRKVEKGREKCVGIVTLDDLVASRSIKYEQLSRIVQSQIFRHRNAIFGKTEVIRTRARAGNRTAEMTKHFYRIVSSKTGLDLDRAHKATQIIVGWLIQRLHYEGASHLISQLPKGLQEDFLDLPAGPDRSIGVETILKDLADQLGIELNATRSLLTQFWATLRELANDAREIDHIVAQLPEEFKDAFNEESNAA